MSQAIELSDESVALLRRQAAAHGLSVDEWILMLAREKAHADDVQSTREKAQAAAARIREIQKRVKPDPEGWTIRDYIEHGRL
jgi:PHD/YefM family antitoxin component YafN of YafNO toxin-antitoxin module